MPAASTFTTKAEEDRWLAHKRSELDLSAVIDERAGAQPLAQWWPGYSKHKQRQQLWEPNDFSDIVALPIPVVYCDIVVTEKQWVHHLRLGKVEERFETQLLSETARLTDLLVAASVGPVSDT